MALCKTPLARVRQLLASKEVDCGVPGYIVGGVAPEVQVSPAFDVEINMIDNMVARKTLTSLPQIAGTQTAAVKFTSNIKGSGSEATVPAFGTWLEGCGLYQVALKKVNGAITGTFQIGETVTNGSGASAYVRLVDKYDAAIYIEVISGTFGNTDTITGGTSTAVIAATAVAAKGYMYVPRSELFQNLTIRSEEDQVLVKEANGALGTFSLSAEANSVGKLDFQYKGRMGVYLRSKLTAVTGTLAVGDEISWNGGSKGVVVHAYTGSDPYLIYTLKSGTAIAAGNAVSGPGSFAATGAKSIRTVDTDNFTSGVTYDSTTPPILQCAGMLLDGYSPVVQSFSFDLGNTVTLRTDFNDCSGQKPATITERKPVVSFNPEVMATSDWDAYDKWRSNGYIPNVQLWLGNKAGNRCVLWYDRLQITSITDGNRDGSAILDVKATPWSTKDDGEFAIFFV